MGSYSKISRVGKAGCFALSPMSLYRYCCKGRRNVYSRLKEYFLGPSVSSKYEQDDEDENAVAERVSDILMAEIKSSYANLEEKQREVRKSMVSIRMGGADYSWLMDKQPEVKLPEGVDTTLKDLTKRLLPEECNRVIGYFRKRAETCTTSEEVLRVFRQTLEEALASRSRPTSPNDMVKRLFSAEKRSARRNKISCIGLPCADESTTAVANDFAEADDCQPSTSNDISMYNIV